MIGDEPGVGARREQDADEDDVNGAEQKEDKGHPDLKSGVLAEGGGSGHGHH